MSEIKLTAAQERLLRQAARDDGECCETNNDARAIVHAGLGRWHAEANEIIGFDLTGAGRRWLAERDKERAS